jgi:Tfp pilus assembly PilM family ATPase
MKARMASFCGLDLQRDYFSVVQYSADEQAVTLLSIQPFSAEGGGDVWKTWKTELKNQRGRLRFFSPAVICAMPAEYAVIKLIQLDTDEQHIAETIAWELGQQMSGSLDEYVWDYQETGGAPNASTRKFLTVAYRRQFVHRMAGVVRSVKLKPQIVDLDLFGLVNVFSANYVEKKKELSLLVHSEFDMTKMVLTHNGEFRDYHSFDHKTASVDPAGFARDLSAEIDRFLAVTGNTDGRPAVYITGSYFQQAVCREAFLESMLRAEMLNPFRSIKCQVKIDEQQVGEYAPQLAIAVGLALRGGG